MNKIKKLTSTILLIIVLIQQLCTPVISSKLEKHDVFEYAIFTGDTRGKLEFEARRVNIEGDVHSNYGIADETSELNVKGKLQAVGKIDLQRGAQVEEVVTNANIIEIPNLYEEILEQNIDSASIFERNTSFSNSSEIDFNNPIIVYGKATFNNTKINGKGNVLAREDIIINSREVDIGKDSKVFYYSANGDIIVKSDNTGLNGVLYAPNGKVIFEGNADIEGSIIARNVVFHGNEVKVKYSPYQRRD